MKRILNIVPMLLLLLVCAGCGPSNTVRLLHKPADSSVLPAPGAPSVAVVQFEDKRPNPQLGIRRDNTSFVSSSPVAEWLSRALADELSRKGLQVSYATSLGQARSANPAYIVTGVIDEVWLKESSAMELSATLRATMVLSNRKGRMLSEGLTASQTKKGLPSTSAAETLLLETVQELVQPAARKANSAITHK